MITTDKPLKFGTLSLEPGTCTINTQPTALQWRPARAGTPSPFDGAQGG